MIVSAIAVAATLISASHTSNAPGANAYARACASCHGARGEGSANAPPLTAAAPALVRFMLESGRMPAGAPGINGTSHAPAFDPAEMTHIVAYVARLGRHLPADLPPAPHDGSATRGRVLYAQNCAPCHGASGSGGDAGADAVAPALRGVSPQEIADAIRSGPSVMPRFGSDVLSESDVADITAYAGALDATNPRVNVDAGGLALYRLGPVAEGFVAWLFGIGALIVYLRATGTTR